MESGWMQEFDGAAYYYRPDFNHRETPFKDIRDFESNEGQTTLAPLI
jgi:hypothetical protein